MTKTWAVVNSLTLSEADAIRLNRDGIRRIPTGGAFVAGDEVIVCRLQAVILKDAWGGDCICLHPECYTVARLPEKKHFARPPPRPAPGPDAGRIRIRQPTSPPPGPVERARFSIPRRPAPQSRIDPAARTVATVRGAWSRLSGLAAQRWPKILLGVVAALIGTVLIASGMRHLSTALGALVDPAAPDPPYPIERFARPAPETVAAIGLHIRKGPGVAYEPLDTSLHQGDEVEGIGETTAADGGHWQYVKSRDGAYGYVNARMLVPKP